MTLLLLIYLLTRQSPQSPVRRWLQLKRTRDDIGPRAIHATWDLSGHGRYLRSAAASIFLIGRRPIVHCWFTVTCLPNRTNSSTYLHERSTSLRVTSDLHTMHRYHDPGQIGRICSAVIQVPRKKPEKLISPSKRSRPAPMLDSVERVCEVKVEEWRSSIQ